MDENPKIKKKNTSDYLSKMLTFFLFLSLIQALVIIFLIFRGTKSEDTSSEVLDPETLSLEATPSPGNSLQPIATRPLSTPTPKPVAKTDKFPLDKNYTYPVKDREGNEVGNIKFILINYELTNQVTVNNFYKAIVTKDKEILVFNIELTNNEDTAIKIMAGDYLRLTKNNEDKLIAPDIDSDPVEVRPQSTKSTKLGFTLLKTDKEITVEVGELGGDKETIEIR
jgi:hypothetical protein